MKTIKKHNISISHSTNLWTKMNTILGVVNLGATYWNYFDRNKDQEMIEMKRTKQISAIMTKLDNLKIDDTNDSEIEELKSQMSQLIAQFQQQISSLTSVNKVLETIKASSDGLSSTLSQEIGELKGSVINSASNLESKNAEIQELINTKHKEVIEKLTLLSTGQSSDLSFLDELPDLGAIARMDVPTAVSAVKVYIGGLTPPVKDKMKSFCLLSGIGLSETSDRYNAIRLL